MSHIDPVDVVANVATGGLYGAGKSVAEGRPGSALENLGPWGSAVHPISQQVANTGNLIGAGAGIGGGLASGQGIGAGGFGTGSSAPYYAGSNIPFLTDAAGNAGMNVVFDPVTGAAGPGAGITPQGYMAGLGGVPAGVGGGGSGLGSGLGAQAGQQFAGLLGGGSPLSMPSPTGGGGGAGGSQGLTQQQLAALTANQSAPHQGLAPQFQARQAGKPEAPGIASTQDLSMAALMGLGGGR